MLCLFCICVCFASMLVLHLWLFYSLIYFNFQISLIAEGKEGSVEVVEMVNNNKFVVRSKKRGHTADIYCPFASVQYLNF